MRLLEMILVVALTTHAMGQNYSKIEQNAKAMGIVPNVVPELALETLLAVDYIWEDIYFTTPCNVSDKGGFIQGGMFSPDASADDNSINVVTSAATASDPQVSWNADFDALYALMLFDMDASYLHYLDVNIPGSSRGAAQRVLSHLSSLNPTPKQNRYVWMLFKQTTSIALPAEVLSNFAIPFVGRSDFDVAAFAEKYGLGAPVGISWQLVAVSEWTPVMWNSVKNSVWVPAPVAQTAEQLEQLACSQLYPSEEQ